MSERGRYWRASCPVQHYYAAAWPGWTIVSTEKLEHPPGVTVQGSKFQGTSSGVGWMVHHLVKPR